MSDPTEDLHKELLRQVNEEYTFDKVTPPVPTTELTLDANGKQKNIQIVAFSMSSDKATAAPRFVAAFFATKQYPKLGFKKGMNYIYNVIKADGTTGFVLVGEDEKEKMLFLTWTPVTNDNTPAPHAIRLPLGPMTGGSRIDTEYLVGGCVEGCGAGHCGLTEVTKDELTATNASEWRVPVARP